MKDLLSATPLPRRNLIRIGTLLTIALFFSFPRAVAASDHVPAQRMTVPRAFEPVVIDGLADDLVWERGAVSYGFLRSDDRMPPEADTRVRAIYDRHHLYLAFTAMEPDAERLGNASGQEQDAVREGDAVGVEIGWEVEGEARRIELWVNPANVVELSEDADLAESIKGLETAVFMREGSWDVEIALPFEALGVKPPRPGEVWDVNFLRHRPDGTAGTRTAWSTSGHRGEMRFGRDLLVYLWSQRPYTGRDEVMVYNPSDGLRQLRAELVSAENGQTVAHQTIYIGPGHRRQHFPMDAPDKGEYYLVVRQTDRPLENDDTLLVTRRPQR